MRITGTESALVAPLRLIAKSTTHASPSAPDIQPRLETKANDAFGAILAGLVLACGTTAVAHGQTVIGSGTSTTNSSTLSGNVAIAPGGQLINGGTVTGAVVNGSAGLAPGPSSIMPPGLSNTGTIGGGVVNNAAGVATNTAGGTISGGSGFQNSGQLTNSATINGSLTNFSGASGNNTGAGIINGGVTGFGGGQVTNGGTINGGIVSTGQITNTGTINGLVTNNSGGTVANNGSGGTFTGGLTNNAGGTVVNNGGTIGGGGGFGNAGQLTNSGTINGSLINYLGGSANNTGAGIVNGGVVNSNQVTNGGTVNGGVSNAGQLTNTGTINGGITNAASGTVANNGGGGTINNGLTNNAGGIVVNNGGTIGSYVLNYGQITSSGTISTSGNFSNWGQLTNSGTINGGLGNGTGGSVVNSGMISSAANEGNVTNNSGGVINGLTNVGTVTNNPGGVINGSVDNYGQLVNSGTINNGVTNQTRSGDGTATVTNNSGGTINGSMVNDSSSQVFNSGTINGNVDNYGLVVNNGTVVGSVFNYRNGAVSGSGVVENLSNAGIVAPGNSIGTLTVTGNYIHGGSATYQAEVSGSGTSDRVAVGGAAALQGGTVIVTAQPGSNYAARTTYTILTAAGGVSGTLASVADPYPFLLTSLGYDRSNIYLTVQIGGFAAAAVTANQYAVGRAIDANVGTASGDFAQVLSAIATSTQSPAQAQATLTTLSGQNYSSFSSTMVQGAQLFMSNFADRTGGGSAANARVALAAACDVACDTAAPALWGAWGGALGGLGTIGANSGTGAVTYNAGGFAAGLDRAVAPGLRVGVTSGYTTGTQWTQGFNGQGVTNTVLAGLYGAYRRDKVHADAVLGYAYSGNQMWRQITLPGLQPRTATGSAGANQFFGQVEAGYRIDIGPVGTALADAFVTPFVRLQGYTGTQNGFTEAGAQSLNLTVAQQTTNSLRSVIGAQLGGAIDLGWREKLALQFRLGWSHEYASTARPVTATLAGAPLMPFTTYGIAPRRDGAVVGFSANTAIADATSIYLRYEGTISGTDSAHALTAGVRMSW